MGESNLRDLKSLWDLIKEASSLAAPPSGLHDKSREVIDCELTTKSGKNWRLQSLKFKEASVERLASKEEKRWVSHCITTKEEKEEERKKKRKDTGRARTWVAQQEIFDAGRAFL